MPENRINSNIDRNDNDDTENIERNKEEEKAIKQTIADLKSTTVKGEDHTCYRTFLCQ